MTTAPILLVNPRANPVASPTAPAIGGGGAVAAFDPIAAAAWHTAFWAEGPEFAALGIADGSIVQTWPDEVGTRDATQSNVSFRPTYRAAATGLGGMPALEGDGGNDGIFTAPFTALAGPFTFVVIGRWLALSSETEILSAAQPNTGQGASLGMSATSFRYYNGGSAVAGNPRDTAAHLFVVLFDGASSSLLIDGMLSAFGTSGTLTATTMHLFMQPSGGRSNSQIAFAALRAAALSAPEKAALLTWSRSHYGTP